MDTFRLKPKSGGRVGRAAPVGGGAARSLRWKYSYGLAKMVSFSGKPAVEGTDRETPLCQSQIPSLNVCCQGHVPIFLGVT